MKRSFFLTLAAIVAFTVGILATFFPAILLNSKGVNPLAATKVWMTEVGVLLLSLGIINFWVRKHVDSPTLLAFLIGNILVQIGLFLIEVLAYFDGTITEISGIIPNSIIHLVLAFGFGYYARRMKKCFKNHIDFVK